MGNALRSKKLARECKGCARARDYVCYAIIDPIGMWNECGDCFSFTTDKNWLSKYDQAVTNYKLKKQISKCSKIIAKTDHTCSICGGFIKEESSYFHFQCTIYDHRTRKSHNKRYFICNKCKKKIDNGAGAAPPLALLGYSDGI